MDDVIVDAIKALLLFFSLYRIRFDFSSICRNFLRLTIMPPCGIMKEKPQEAM